MFQRLLVITALSASGLAGWEQRGASAPARPTMPLEEAGACPFEGCQFGTWTARASVVARQSRSTSSARSFTVRKGETVTALQVRNSAGLAGWTNQADEFDGKDAFGGLED